VDQIIRESGELQTGEGAIEARLRLNVQRLEILHEIDHAILSAQDAQAIACTALRRMHQFIPGYLASSVVIIDLAAGSARVLALESTQIKNNDVEKQVPKPSIEILEGSVLGLEVLSVDLEDLQNGMPFSVADLQIIPALTPLQQRMSELGIRSYLSVPLRFSGELIGLLNLAADEAGVFRAEQVLIAQEVANSLAVGIQQARLRNAEQQRRNEAEVMRDVMAALAGAADLNQTLEIILVNLRNFIRYDRAGLFLLDEKERYVLAERSRQSQGSLPGAHGISDPLIVELRKSRLPIIVSDIQDDPRFANWPDMAPIRGWIGAPLLAGERMIGLLSLGSLEARTYGEPEAAMLQAFTSQVAVVLERTWRQEQSHRRSEELEVLSNISIALSQAESRESSPSALVETIARFFNAVQGAFLTLDKSSSELAVTFSTNPALIGLAHPYADDTLWQALHRGEPMGIEGIDEFLRQNPAPLYRALLEGAEAAALIPLRTKGKAFGLLFFVFNEKRRFNAEELRLLNAIAEIASTSLHRAVVLEGLERQVDVRTKHLSTLYRINEAANEPQDLPLILEQVLRITLEALGFICGMVHLLEDDRNLMRLVASMDVPEGMSPYVDVLHTRNEFWRSLLEAQNPLVIPDMTKDERMPTSLAQHIPRLLNAYIGAPIRAEGHPLGLLSVFGRTILEYTIDDITLLATIADQIGIFVDRARLIKRAEQAAVMEERQRLARELHDSVTQLLYSQVLFAGASIKNLNHNDLELAQQHLKRIDQAALQALREMRLLVYELRPTKYLEEGLVRALERRLEAVEKRTGMNANLIVEGELSLDETTEMVLYRIAQEALNNTLKHSGANTVIIKIRSCDGKVTLMVTDDGCGFNLQDKLNGEGIGLDSMRERAAALGIRLRVVSKPGVGTRIVARLEESK